MSSNQNIPSSQRSQNRERDGCVWTVTSLQKEDTGLFFRFLSVFMKSCKILILSAILFVLMCNASCVSSSRRFDSSMFTREKIKCQVLSRVVITYLPTSNGPLIFSKVKIQVLEPEYLRGVVTKLVLQSRMLMDYTGHINGELWHDIDSIQDITIYANTKNLEMYLYPRAKGTWRKLSGSGISFWGIRASGEQESAPSLPEKLLCTQSQSSPDAASGSNTIEPKKDPPPVPKKPEEEEEKIP